MKRIALLVGMAALSATAVGAGLDDPEFKLMLGADGTNSPTASLRSGEMLSRTVTEKDGVKEIVWKGHPTAGADFTVTAHVAREGETRVYDFAWTGYAGRRLVETLLFPQVVVPRTDDATILFPYGGGSIRRADWKALKPGAAARADAVQSFHMAALLNGSGLSCEIEQRDARTQPTRFEFRQGAAPLTTEVSSGYLMPVSRGTSEAFRMPFDVAVTLYEGGWYEAARIYARHARQTAWYKTAKARDFGRLRDIGMWFWNRRTSDIVIPPVEKFMADSGVPAALDWYWWHKTSYDTGYPNFWPPREPEDQFRAAVKHLNEKGIYCQTYMNGMTWDCDDPSWKDGGEQGVKYLKDGTFHKRMWNVFTKHRLANMCGEAPVYQRRLRDQVKTLRGCGFDGQYLDMIGNASYGGCWRKDHAHPLGGGDHMVENFRKYVSAVRADNPGLQLCTEDVNEAYMDLFESVIVLAPSYERFAGKGEVMHEAVPAFQAVYHGAIALFGSFAMLDGIPAWDPLWPDEERWTKEEAWEKLFPDQFQVEIARGVTFGMQPTVHNFRINNATEARYADGYRFMIDTARFYHANRDLLFDGEMLHPGKMTCAQKKVEFLQRGTYSKNGDYGVSWHVLPTVFHSVWRAPSGRVGAVLVNWSRTPQHCALRTPDVTFEGTLPPQSWKLVGKTGKGLTDIPYLEGEDLAAADDYRAARCKLDIDRPAAGTNLPVLVWFHGGGLTGGGKKFPRPAGSVPFVQVAANYRLLGKTGLTSGDAPISDAAAAVAWTLRHIGEYGGNPKKVFVSGFSAGGYLTMMVGMDPRWLAKHGFKTTDLAGLVPESGQATTHFSLKRLRDDPRQGIVPVIDEYAPLWHVTNWKEIPPIACICGTPPWEWKGRAEENELLIGTLKGLGHKRAWYVRLPYANHGRAFYFSPGYLEGFVLGKYPDDLHLVEGEKW